MSQVFSSPSDSRRDRVAPLDLLLADVSLEGSHGYGLLPPLRLLWFVFESAQGRLAGFLGGGFGRFFRWGKQWGAWLSALQSEGF